MAEEVSIGIYLLCYAGALVVTIGLALIIVLIGSLWDRWRRRNETR